MTEPAADEPATDDPSGGDSPGSKLDAALGAFKPRDDAADTTPVTDSGRPRMNWNPVTDRGGSTDTQPQPRSSFQFDLGSALAKLSGSVDEPVSTEPAPGDATDDEPLEPLPARRPAEPEARTDVAEIDEPAAPLPVRGAVPVARVEPVEELPVRRAAPVEVPVARVEPVEELPVRRAAPVEGPVARVEPVEELPVRGAAPVKDVVSRAVSPEPDTHPPVVDRLPTRTPRTAEPAAAPAPTPEPPAPVIERPAARTTEKRSVFEDASPAPTLPAIGATTFAATTDAPTLPPAAASVPSGMPTLPASVPAAPPPVVAPVENAPSTPELNALRAAQLRANRNERQGKLFGRSLLAFIVVGGLVAAALIFGRSYLFPTEWTAELTPLVDEVQSERGAEFDQTLTLVERPAEEYEALVTEHVFGPDWNTRLPEWRALGLAGGDGAVADVQLRVASMYPAYYDAESAELVSAEGVAAETRDAALRLALDLALVDQLTGGDAPELAGLGLTGLETTDVVGRRAIDAATSGIAGNAPDAVADLAGVPLPVAYQLRAIDELGDDLLVASAGVRPGDDLPESVALLDDGADQAVGGLRQPGDQQVLEPVALGPDAWALVWGARLAPATAGRMADSLAADSYAVVNRSGATCFLAVFEAESDVAATSLLTNLTTWVGSAPAGAQAAATQLGPTRVQLEACDPGADAAVAPPVGSVDLVLQRQLERLSAGG